MKTIISLFCVLVLFQSVLADNVCIDDLCVNYESDRSKDIDTVDISGNGKTLTVQYKNHWLNAPIKFNFIEFTKSKTKIMVTYFGNSISGKIITLNHNDSNLLIKKIETFTTNKHSSSEVCIDNFIKSGDVITLVKTAEIDKKCEKVDSQDSLMDLNELVLLMEKHTFKNIVDIADMNIYLTQEKLKNSNVTIYNNIAYYLQKSGEDEKAVYLLGKILEKFPNRTVAYLNLADSLKALKKNKQALKNYKIYLNMMRKNKKSSRIPKRVVDFILESSPLKSAPKPAEEPKAKKPEPVTETPAKKPIKLAQQALDTNAPKNAEIIKAEKAEPIKTAKGSSSFVLLASMFGLLSLRLKNIM